MLANAYKELLKGLKKVGPYLMDVGGKDSMDWCDSLNFVKRNLEYYTVECDKLRKVLHISDDDSDKPNDKDELICKYYAMSEKSAENIGKMMEFKIV